MRGIKVVRERERRQMNKIGTINKTSAVGKLVMPLSESG